MEYTNTLQLDQGKENNMKYIMDAEKENTEYICHVRTIAERKEEK
jgi:hypothetical protein